MPTPEEQRAFLLARLPTTSWDWEADEAFAQFLGREDAASEIRRAIDSASVVAIRIVYFEMYGGEIQRLRLRRLRELQAEGKVASYWLGLGPGAFSEFGARRVRGYDRAARATDLQKCR